MRAVSSYIKPCEVEIGKIDEFHSNATYSDRSQDDMDILDIEMDLFDAIMNIIASLALCARYAILAMLHCDGGVILFPSLEAAYVLGKGRTAYSMSKAAIHALIRHIATRWRHKGIRSDVLVPAVIMHPKLEAKSPHLREWAMKRVEGRDITGQVLTIDGGSSMRQYSV